MGSRFRKLRQYRIDEEPSINLTPLIDVVFSILIMFIVVAPLLELDQVVLAEGSPDPHSKAVAVKEGGPISIHVHQDNTVWLNQKALEPSNLAAELKIEKQKNPTAHPQIYHDKRAHFGTYQLVKNGVEDAGFEKMDVILKPQ